MQEVGSAATSSGRSATTTCLPSSPPSGPRSIIQSAVLITFRFVLNHQHGNAQIRHTSPSSVERSYQLLRTSTFDPIWALADDEPAAGSRCSSRKLLVSAGFPITGGSRSTVPA